MFHRLDWPILVVAIAIVGFVAWGLMPRPVAVDTVRIARGPLEVIVEEEATTRLKDRYVVSAPVAGTACRSPFDVGDAVAKGEVVAKIRPRPSEAPDPRARASATAAVAAAEAALASARERAEAARAEADLAVSELARLEPLSERDLVARDAVDRARAEVRRTEAHERSAAQDVEVARHELEAARTRLTYTGTDVAVADGDVVEVTAPVAGLVLDVAQSCEGVVTAGQPLIEIGDVRSLEVVAEVLSADAVRIEPGMPVRFERWGGGEPLEGIVTTVEPVGFTKVSALGVEEQRVVVVSDFVSPEPRWRRLGDGYRVEASFVLWQADDVLTVPTGALFRAGNEHAVFRVEDGRARVARIAIGRRGGMAAEVVDGLEAGDTIVIHPGDDVTDGGRVRPRAGARR